MESFRDWIFNLIREENKRLITKHGWLEEKYLDWSFICSNALSHILEGGSFIVLSDEPRIWFQTYVLQNINHPKKNRPFVPFFPLANHISQSVLFGNQDENLQLIKDMLDIAYKDYAFFYIGRSETPFAKLSAQSPNSFLWIIGESMSNSFRLDDNEFLDSRLLELFKIFDLSLSASIFNTITLQET